jgi:hypothetical protein
MNIEGFSVTPIKETKLQSESLVIPYKLSEPVKPNNIIEMQAANYYRDIKELEKELEYQVTFDRQQQLLLQKHILEQRALLINALDKLPNVDLPNNNNNNFIPKIYPSTNTLPTMKTIPVETTKSAINLVTTKPAMKPITETTKSAMKPITETTKPFNKHEYIMSEIKQYKINQSKPTQAPCSILDMTSIINDLGLDTSAKSYCSMDKILDLNLMNKIQLTKADSQSLKSIFSFNK